MNKKNIKEKLIKRLLSSPLNLPRRFQAYCLGAAKTGTTSVASMFNDCYLSAHEMQVGKTTDLIINYLEQKYSENEMISMLIARDKKLHLEIESSHLLVYLGHLLTRTFPHAKFIVTIREPYSWLQSRLNYHFFYNPPAWKRYRDYFWWRNHQGYSQQEKRLEELGLCSLDVYLSQYAEIYRLIESHIPNNKRLIVKTSNLNNSIPKIADFLSLNQLSIQPKHSKKASKKISLLVEKEINPEFVREKIWHHCEDIITKYFPETIINYHLN